MMTTNRTNADKARRRNLLDAATGIPPEEPPAVGTPVFDTRRRVVGEYRGQVGGRWLLRPPGGGKEWEVTPDHVSGTWPLPLPEPRTADDQRARPAHGR